MSSDAPLVTIGMPVYNGERFISQALDSLLAQEHRDFELIISDNGSRDRTEEICRSYAARDPRIRYQRQEVNRGAAWNYNHVLHEARGKYFKWSAHDDRCSPAFLARCLEVLERSGPEVVLVYPRTSLIDEEGKTLEVFEDRLNILHRRPHQRLGWFVRHINLCNAIHGLIRAEALRRTRLIDSFVGSDAVLLAELCILGGLHELPEVLFHRRIHPGASRQANTTPQELAKWFNPQVDHGLLPPRWKVAYECMRSIGRSSLSAPEKALCWATFASLWSYRRIRVRGGELKRFLRRALSGGKASPPAAAAVPLERKQP